MIDGRGDISAPRPDAGRSRGVRIEIDSLSKRYGSTLAVDDLSFEARPGRVTAFLGPNGAGKSTTLRILLGLMRPSGGSATFEGQSFEELDDVPGTVGAVMEESIFHPGRSARSHLRVLATMAGLDLARVDEVLGIVELAAAADRRVGQFSLGMRQRLALAAALLGKPGVLILDEPANGLDPPGIRWLRDFLRHLAEQGATVLISSHLLSEVSQLADDVVVINQGRLVRAAPLVSLLEATGDTYWVRSRDASRLHDLLAERGVGAQITDADTLMLSSNDIPIVVNLAADFGLQLLELRPQTESLEEAFLQLVAPTPSVEAQR